MTDQGFEAIRSRKLFPDRPAMPLPGGYVGKILRVNLTQGTVKEENLPGEKILRQYLGGQGLGQLVLMHELEDGTHPLSPQNPLVIMTGPLTGTGKTPAGTVAIFTCFSTISGFGPHPWGTVVSSSTTGYWASFLKFAGYDGIIVTGAAAKPVYLWIHNGRVEIRDASKIWGQDSYNTIDLVKKDIGQPEAKVACIGPAGENLLKSAMVIADYNHGACHGAGVVMGAKKLKAIAVFGARPVRVKDADRLVEVGNRWRSKITPYVYPQGRATVGFGHILKTVNYKNWQSSVFPEANKDFEKMEYTPRPCFQCNRDCPFDAKLTSGKHAGYVARLNAGSEHMEGSAFTFGVGGMEVRYLSDLSNKLGIEAGLFGCAAGAAFEAFERELITLKETDGLELRWGNAEAVEKLFVKVAHRDGWLANLIAEGPRAVASQIKGAEKFTVFVKEGAPAMHDWRPYAGHMLGHLVCGGGIKPQFHAYELDAPSHWCPDLGYPKRTNPHALEGKARETFLDGIAKVTIGNAGACWFGVTFGKAGILHDFAEAVAATTGWQDFNLDEVLSVGERTWQMEHIFYLRHGWSPEDDLRNNGARFMEPVPDGPYQGFSVAQLLPRLLQDFYEVCGWDRQSGRPTQATLKKLGLEEFSFLIS